MFYDKQIKYLDYLENGEKIRSAGFVKIEVIDKICNIQVNVTGLHPSENCTRDVHLSGMSEQGVLGSITLQSGKGSLVCRHISADRLCEEIGYEKLRSIRISLGKDRELFCCWREDEKQKEERHKDERQQSAIQEQEKREYEEDKGVGISALKETLTEEISAEPAVPEMNIPQPSSWDVPITQEDGKETLAEKQMVVQQPVSEPPAEEQSWQSRHPAAPSVPPRLSEDKWKQLSDIYPHISPFHDERDYLSIGPNDFVVLPKKYYRLISNSFLLHGFYNYGHLILTRTVKRGEETFYLGVPGNFFEREKQVALMFGFESFECKKEPAMDGDFGYFMIRIEL